MQLTQTASAPAITPRNLHGKSAIVTGSTSGIGLGIARALAESGVNVMFNGFGSSPDIDVTREDLERRYRVATAFSDADMSKDEDIAQMIADARTAFGQIDILINNAGIQHVEAIETFPVSKWNAIIAVDLSAAFHTIRAVVPEMKERNWGRIINIASAHALVASPFKSAYVAAKHGILGLTKTAALELAEYRHYGQRDLPWVCFDAACPKADPRDGEGPNAVGGAGRPRRPPARAADTQVCHDRRAWRSYRVSLPGRRTVHYRRGASRRRWLDGAVNHYAAG